MAQPDLITARAVAAREEIGRAFADRIRQVEDVSDLEDLLPQFEKFLESPPERRLRNVRAGVLTALIGLGVTLGILVVSSFFAEVALFTGLGVVVLLVGLGIVINGLYFTAPRSSVKAEAQKDIGSDKMNDMAIRDRTAASTEDLEPRILKEASVTEGTTRHLKNGS